MSNHTPVDIFYFNHPDLYELVQKAKNRYQYETDFLTHQFETYKVKTILDVWCWTWLHLSLLKDNGFAVQWIDLNEHMIAYAINTYLWIEFTLADMRNFKLQKAVDAIYSLCTTFAYNVSNEDITRTILTFRKNLNKNWIVIVETFNPIVFIKSKSFLDKRISKEPYNQFWYYCEIDHYIDEMWQKMIEERKIIWVTNNTLIKTDTLEYRLFFPQEVQYFFESNGFVVREQMNSYTDSTWDNYRLITVAQKK